MSSKREQAIPQMSTAQSGTETKHKWHRKEGESLSAPHVGAGLNHIAH